MAVQGRRRIAIGRCLGRGGFGEVYRAVLRAPGGLESEVALKVLRRGVDLRDDAVRRLRDEGRMLARLDHPVVLRVLDLVEIEGRVALVTEYVDGRDLSDCLRAADPMSRRALLQVIGSVAGALDAARTAPGDGGRPLDLVHRDVKPSNIRIGRHGQVKLLDFGVARTDAIQREARTSSQFVVGSLPYMAPERFVSAAATPASDVFALGCTLYEALAGERFYPRGTLRDVSRIAVDPTRYATWLARCTARLPEDLPEDLRDAVVRMLAHDPAARPTAGGIADWAEGAADALGGESLRAWCRRIRWPTPRRLEGPLEGRTVTVEGDARVDVQADAAPPPAPTPRSPAPTVVRVLSRTARRARRRRRVLVAASALATLGLLAGGALVVAAVLVGLLREPPEAPRPAVADVLVQHDTGPVAPGGATDDPEPAIPVAPHPPASTAGVARHRVEAAGVAVELRREGGRHYRLPAVVPEGAYVVWAAFGTDFERVRPIEVGRPVRVVCPAELRRCHYE